MICAAVQACAKPVVVYRSPGDAVAEQYGHTLRVQMLTGERYTVYNASVRHDSLHAIRVPSPAGADSTVSLPLSDVRSVTRAERGLSAVAGVPLAFVAGACGGFLLAVGLLVAGSN
jgi:hypothetical protein